MAVLPGRTFITHGDLCPYDFDKGDKVFTVVFRPLIGMDDLRDSIMNNCILQSSNYQKSVMETGDIDSDYFPGKKINYGSHVDKLSLVFYVGKVRTPDLVGFDDQLALQKRLYQIGNTGWSFTDVLFLDKSIKPAPVGFKTILFHNPPDPVMSHPKIQSYSFMSVIFMIYHYSFNLAFELKIGFLPYSFVVER